MNPSSFYEYFTTKAFELAQQPDYKCEISQYRHLSHPSNSHGLINIVKFTEYQCAGCKSIIIVTSHDTHNHKYCFICSDDYCSFNFKCICSNPHNCAYKNLRKLIYDDAYICIKCIDKHKWPEDQLTN